MRNLLRGRRIATATGHILMAPLDHGASMGPIAGLVDAQAAARAAVEGGATCLAVHKGLVPVVASIVAAFDASEGPPFSPPLAPPGAQPGLLLHLSASTDLAPDPLDKRIVATVEEALRLGCDGVSVHVNVGSPTEARQIEDVGRISRACTEWGVPLIAMMYPRGPKIADPFDAAAVAHAARLGAELGADAVKVPYTGSETSFRSVVEGCPVPVLVAGGAKRDDFDAFLADVASARRAGARGVSVGRNVFQQPEAARAMAAIARVFP